VGDLFGVDPVVLVFATVNGFEVKGVSQHKVQAGGLAGIGEPIPAEHALGADGQVMAIGRDKFEKELEVVVFDVGVDELFAVPRSMTQTYLWRAWRSIPQLNWVVDV
jgi:hypothetical protein